jgi:hypothetical protein
MSYSEFKMEDLKTKLGLAFIQDQVLFPEPPVQEVSEDLQKYLTKYKPLALAIDTEKARSEYIVAPILGELKLQHRKEISLFSGIDFNVDKEQGLSGRCDFIISRSDDQYSLTAPVVVMVEAKNDNIKSGIPQCGAEMVAAQRYNAQKQNDVEIVYGCVTTGTNWKFLKLYRQNFYIDVDEYYIDIPEKILGILTAICLSNGNEIIPHFEP